MLLDSFDEMQDSKLEIFRAYQPRLVDGVREEVSPALTTLPVPELCCGANLERLVECPRGQQFKAAEEGFFAFGSQGSGLVAKLGRFADTCCAALTPPATPIELSGSRSKSDGDAQPRFLPSMSSRIRRVSISSIAYIIFPPGMTSVLKPVIVDPSIRPLRWSLYSTEGFGVRK